MRIELICEKQQEGEAATHSYGRDSLIQVSFGQVSLILQLLNGPVYKGLVRGADIMGRQCSSNCVRKSDSYPFAPEELKRSVAVGEIVRSTENATSFHGKTFPAQHLEQGQQPHPVLQVLDQVLHPHRRLSLAQVRVDPVDKGLPLDPLLLI